MPHDVWFISFLETFNICCALCVSIRNASVGGQSKEMMIGSKGVVNGLCGKICPM
jgi:hypothetical protein